MNEPRNYGHTPSGKPITDETVERLAGEAAQGFDVGEVLSRRGKRGRPALGSGPSTVESVRLGPELRERVIRRAQQQGVSVSEVIRQALHEHLEAS